MPISFLDWIKSFFGWNFLNELAKYDTSLKQFENITINDFQHKYDSYQIMKNLKNRGNIGKFGDRVLMKNAWRAYEKGELKNITRVSSSGVCDPLYNLFSKNKDKNDYTKWSQEEVIDNWITEDTFNLEQQGHIKSKIREQNIHGEALKEIVNSTDQIQKEIIEDELGIYAPTFRSRLNYDFRPKDGQGTCLPPQEKNIFDKLHQVNKTLEACSEKPSICNYDPNNEKDRRQFWSINTMVEKLNTDLNPQNHEFEMGNKIKVKINITEIPNRTLKVARKPAAQMGYKPMNFGWFHTALIVGPWYLDWTSSSLCLPSKKPHSGNSQITVDICELNRQEFQNQHLESLAGEICRWNINKLHDDRPKKDNRVFGSCQDFVVALMKSMRINENIWKENAIGEWFNCMKNRGYCPLELSEDLIKDLKKKYQEKYSNLEPKEIQKLNHQKLDDLVRDCMSLDGFHSNSNAIFRKDYFLLKAIDRSFWLRYLKNNNINRNQPDWKESEEMTEDDGDVGDHNQIIDRSILNCEDSKCPFGDPRIFSLKCS